MLQSFWTYALLLVLSIAPVVFLAKVLWASHNMAATANVRKIITYLLGFGVTAVASIMILAWAFRSGLPIVADLFANNPATTAINDAGLQLTGALDTLMTSGGSTLPNNNGGAGSTGFTIASFTNRAGDLSLPVPPPLDGGSSLAAPGSFALPQLLATATTAAMPTITRVPAPTIDTPTIDNRPDWAAYTVKPGDSMGGIARRYGINLNELCAMNNAATRGNCNLIRPGMALKLPSRDGQPPRELPQVARPLRQTVNRQTATIRPTTAPAVRQAATNGAQTYTIQAGDTIYSIAGKFGGINKVYAICLANRATLGDNCDNLVAGATIVIR